MNSACEGYQYLNQETGMTNCILIHEDSSDDDGQIFKSDNQTVIYLRGCYCNNMPILQTGGIQKTEKKYNMNNCRNSLNKS